MSSKRHFPLPRVTSPGYVIYGSSTMLVYTTGLGMTGFTFDPSIGEYCLSHYQMVTPEDGNMYSVNEGYYKQFSPGIQKYLDKCKGTDGKDAVSSRYIGYPPPTNLTIFFLILPQ
ncbi:MAG: hypothetical protein ACP5E3_08380 [Bacteroidales bacterium]